MSDDLFTGFEEPKENWCKLPFVIIENLSRFTSKAELCVVLYILRHTWGYKDFVDPKPITVDEFQYGRKRKDGTRIDSGTGLSAPSIRSGLKAAEANGFIEIATDDSDKGRVVKSYRLAMKIGREESLPPENDQSSQGVKSLPPDLKEFTPRGQTSLPRTEIDTLERYIEKDSAPADAGAEVIEFPADADKKNQRERKPNPLFDATKLHIFGIDDPDAKGGRIAKISNWLNGKYEGKGDQKVGKIARPAEPKHVEAFAKYCKGKGITPPRDFVKFVEAWREWATSQKTRPALPRPADDEVPIDFGVDHYVRTPGVKHGAA